MSSTIATAVEEAPTPRPQRRDGEARIFCDRTLPIMRLGDPSHRKLRAQVTDCSELGIGMMLGAPLEPGEQFTARVELDQPTLLLYTVRYCIPMAADQFRIGATFTGYAASSFHGRLADVLDALAGR